MKLKSEVLKQILKDRDISQRQFANLLEVAEEFLSRLFAGKVNLTIDMLLKISRALGIDPKSLLEFEELADFSRFLNEYTQKEMITISKSLTNLTDKLCVIPRDMANNFADDLKKAILKRRKNA